MAAWGRGCREGLWVQALLRYCRKNLQREALCPFFACRGWWPVPEVVPGAQAISAKTLPDGSLPGSCPLAALFPSSLHLCL